MYLSWSVYLDVLSDLILRNVTFPADCGPGETRPEVGTCKSTNEFAVSTARLEVPSPSPSVDSTILAYWLVPIMLANLNTSCLPD